MQASCLLSCPWAKPPTKYYSYLISIPNSRRKKEEGRRKKRIRVKRRNHRVAL
ncbi:MAG: hypothetical protein ACRCT1_13545 [Microcoleaceae cyanobacterium]